MTRRLLMSQSTAPLRSSPGGVPGLPGICLHRPVWKPQPNWLEPSRRCQCGAASRAPLFPRPNRETSWPPWHSRSARARTRSCHRTCRQSCSDWPLSCGSRAPSCHAFRRRFAGYNGPVAGHTSKQTVVAMTAYMKSRHWKSTARLAWQRNGLKPTTWGVRIHLVSKRDGVGERHVPIGACASRR